jgi:DNA-binding response OmpR family regulator/DNA-binding CsgD family transcriptional regulator
MSPQPQISPKQTILIVDDVPANLGVLLDFLDSAGYEVLVAESGKGALSQLAYARPDIILLDVTMPGIDGYETCRRLKSDERWRDTPVLFLTALNEPADKVCGFEVGAVDFISKPLHPEEVLARVRAHLQIRSLQQDLEEKNALLEKAVALRIEAENQLQQSLDRAVLVVSERDKIQFCTRLARRLLKRYFPSAKDEALLPPPLVDWSSNGEAKDPWHAELKETRLEVRMFAEPQPGACFMLLLEERALAGGSPASLLCLGLTNREAEVLFWIAHGKTSPEIAIILDAALNTVKKHVQNILLKLGVETRLAAALRATEILGMADVDAAKFRAE